MLGVTGNELITGVVNEKVKLVGADVGALVGAVVVVIDSVVVVVTVVVVVVVISFSHCLP